MSADGLSGRRDPYAMKWRSVRYWPPDTVSCSWTGHRTWVGAWLRTRRRRATFSRFPEFDRSRVVVERASLRR